MSNAFIPELRSGHCAVSLDSRVIIIGGCGRQGPLSTRVIWIYNLYTEEWKEHTIPGTRCAPEPFHGAVAAAIRKTVYTFGGCNPNTFHPSNALWKLSQTKGGCFTWSFCKSQCKEKSPSPRDGHSGWKHEGKLWIFAGVGHLPEGYLNDNGDIESGLITGFAQNNQLLCFDPNTENWTNPQCFGSIPTPRSGHASAICNDKVWLFGGNNLDLDCLGDMFELNMSSLTWCQIQMYLSCPTQRANCTLTYAAYGKLVLHGGQTATSAPLSDTWIMDLTSHSWRQFTSREDQAGPRRMHTGSKGLNDRVVIIGGCGSSLDTYVESNIINVRLSPKSLMQVAMQAIRKHRNELPWKFRPTKLTVKVFQ